MHTNTKGSRRLRFIAALATAPLVLTACGSTENDGVNADGEWSPTKAIEITAPADTGGGWDTLARTTATVLETTGLADQNVQVVNKPGAGGAIGWAYIAANAGDPHKLFVTSPPIILVPMAGDSDYGHTDFTPIARMATDYMVYLVDADSDIEDFNDLVDAVDSGDADIAGGSSPGSMDHIASAGALTAGDVAAEAINYVAFDGGGEAITALLGGHVDAAAVGVSEAISYLESGDLRAVGITSEERNESFPDIPTLKEQGVDYTFDIWRGVMGPADMSEEQVAYYETLVADLMETDEWKAEAEKLGWLDGYQDSEEFSQFLDDSVEEYAAVLEEVGLQ